MDIKALLESKEIKPKEKTSRLSGALLEGELAMNDLLLFAKTANDANKATCIETVEYATKQKPEIINADWFDFAIVSLAQKAPRVKWEAAKVIGNTAGLMQDRLEQAIGKLLDNTTHTGTVVRWSAAFALGEILKLKLALNNELINLVEAIIEKEEKNSIRKIYLAALKKSLNY